MSNGSVKTSHHWHPNTSINFDANGVWIRVSLNVPPEVAQYLSPNNVSKGKYRMVYALRMHVPTDMICRNSMEFTQNILLENCKKNIRNAKQKAFKATTG